MTSGFEMQILLNPASIFNQESLKYRTERPQVFFSSQTCCAASMWPFTADAVFLGLPEYKPRVYFYLASVDSTFSTNHCSHRAVLTSAASLSLVRYSHESVGMFFMEALSTSLNLVLCRPGNFFSMEDLKIANLLQSEEGF